MDRSPEALMQLVNGIDVANNFAFLPHRRVLSDGDATPPLTLCNCYVTCCTAALGCPIPPTKANEQAAWLQSSDGQLAGWMPVDSETARQRAELGYPTVACWVNPTGAHGHIALVVPRDSTGPVGVYVSAAGAQNFVRAPLARSFGSFLPRYFTHE